MLRLSVGQRGLALGALKPLTRPFFSFLSPSKASNALVKSHRETRVVPFSQEQMFDVVADVDRYCEFLPFCVDSKVLRRPNANVMEAALRVGFRVFTESYTSRVFMVRPNKIVIRSIESPTFKRIESEWHFRPSKTGENDCEIDFTVTFEVASFLHANAIQLFFDDVALSQLNAFVGRARKQYGPYRACPSVAASSPPPPSSSTASSEPAVPFDRHADICSKFANGSTASAEAVERACRRIKGGISHESFGDLAEIFHRHANARERLDYVGFCGACAELGEHYQDLKPIAESSVVAGAVFSSLETSAAPSRDGLSLDDFVVGAYMMTQGTFEQKAHNLFRLIDTSGDGKISREELTKALERRVRTVKKIFPKLLRDQVALQMGSTQGEALEKSQDAAVAQGVAALETLMREIEHEIPLAVNQVFQEADLDQDDFIHEDEWLLAWQSHPEFVELLSIDGLKKVAQWASVVHSDDGPAPADGAPDTRLTYMD